MSDKETRLLSQKNGVSVKGIKKAIKIALFIIATIVVLLIAIYINHGIQTNKEKELLSPMGQMVKINGANMSVYVEGSGDKTLVFMSGGGTSSPILDFKSLFSLLSDKYRMVVVEKFGYGFSDVVDSKRDIASILADTRAALNAANIEAPYILCPHSMSGIEALYWSQQFPEEVSAIMGLDMAVPDAYKDYEINLPMLKLGQFAANVGITRLLPYASESEAIKHGTLSEQEKEIYRAVFYQRTATKTMINEVKHIKENAQEVSSNGVAQVPLLLFVSNGEDTGWDKEKWRGYQNSYIREVDNGILIELDCPHYLHDYEYIRISEIMKEYLEKFSSKEGANS